ncbi:MAG: UDP-N-acetylmuramate:L-alanyl-gamma-D-glutamyl-meso-diaminopimelate ligase, partial [Gammaproteobacteria bacterium]|nr:UDP-N-acetylmuramate:L-alanyl-gamma-D-glutamyl-meso-diaminopimelate ligase [Gammaproteobacteria bacterium]
KDIDWALEEVINELGDKAKLFSSVDDMIKELVQMMKPEDHIMIMSNGGFDGMHKRLLLAMEA